MRERPTKMTGPAGRTSARHFGEWLRAFLYRLFAVAVALSSRAHVGRRLPIVRRAYFAIASLLRPGVTKVGSRTVYFHRHDNAVSHSLRSQGTYEPYELELIAHLLQPGDCAVDVGANIGLHTMAMSQACGPSGRVVAFEPDPNNLRLLHRNLAANHCHNVDVLPAAASDQPGVLKLFLSSTNFGDHRLYDPHDGRASVDVSVVRVADALTHRKLHPKLVKIDVQGWEPNVLAGALPVLIGTDPLALITEFWTEGLMVSGSSAPKYLALLDSLNLDLYDIDVWRGTVEPLPRERASFLRQERDTNILGLRNITLPDLAHLFVPSHSLPAS